MSNDVLTVLIIDDEVQIRRLVRNALDAESLAARPEAEPSDGGPEVRVIEASTARQGIDLAAAELPALVILDLGLPDMEGVDACREMRRWLGAPILVLSARHADIEKVSLLDAGADDYLTKPFSTIELMARIRAQLRRARQASRSGAHSTQTSFGGITVDAQRHRVERDGTVVHLTPTEWGLLRAFMAHPRRTLTHDQLFQSVWGNASGDAQQYLRVYVGHLRRKIEDDAMRPRFIHTEPGVGYRFEPDGELP